MIVALHHDGVRAKDNHTMHSLITRLPALSILILGTIVCLPTRSLAAAEWKPGVPRTAYATLFEWSWDAVARECTNFLGPKGYAAVQVSPPQEHVGGGAWWTRYQPVSYQIQSRSGNREQFRAMVATCRTAGVDVYADAVINHMAAIGNDFPSVPYGSGDFHHGCTIQQSDYGNPGNRNNVTQCSLVGLPDLDTASSGVQGKIAAYLLDLRSLGVAGFRIDAAKHIRPAELAAIKARVSGDYFFTQEIIRDGNVAPELPAYTAMGSINEFSFTQAMKDAFLNRNGASPSTLNTVIGGSNFLPSAQATIFVHNHDTERKECNSYSVGGVCDSLNTFNGSRLYLADVFMLGFNYGYPTVASGYYFDNHDSGPPNQPYSGTETIPSNCSSTIQMGKWDCIHRDRRVANMVGFRNYVQGSAVSNWVSGDINQIAFSRSGKGFLAINNGSTTWQRTFTTGLADGSYCNVLASDTPESGVCPGTTLAVSGGQLTLSLEPGTAAAIHIGARPGGQQIIAPLPGISELTSNSVKVSWTASSDVRIASYKVYLNGTLRATSTGNSVVISGLTPSTRYTLALRVTDGAGNLSAATTAAPFTTLPASNNATVYYKTNWSKAWGFNTRYAPMPGIAMSTACSGYKVKTVSLSTLTNAKVQFHNGAGTSDPLTYTVVKGINIIRNGTVSSGSNPCDTTAPTVPAGLSLSAVSSSSATISWASSTDATAVSGYRIYRDGILLGSSPNPTWTDTTIVVGSTYSYTVRAYDAAGNTSDASLPVVLDTRVADSLIIRFKVTATTGQNESIYITGNRAELGNWGTTAAADRQCVAGTAQVWTCTISFPLGSSGTIEYKYQKLGNGVIWESGSNRSWTLPSASATREDGTFRQ